MIRSITLSLLIGCATLCFGALPAAAKPKIVYKQGKDKVIYKKKTIIDLEGGSVEGELARPDGSYMVQKSRPKFRSLIRPRTNFAPEMWKNARKL